MLDQQRQEQDISKNHFVVILVLATIVMGWTFYTSMTGVDTPAEPPADTVETTATVPADDKPVDLDTIVAEASAPASPEATMAPVAQDQPTEEEIVLENDHLRLVFTSIGARLKKATVKLDNALDEKIQLIPSWGDRFDSHPDVVYPMSLRFDDDFLGDTLNQQAWKPVVDGNTVTFTHQIPGEIEVTKTFRLDETPMVVDIDVRCKNLQNSARLLGKDRKPAFSLYWGPNVNSGDADKFIKQDIIVHHPEADNDRFVTSKWKSGTWHNEKQYDVSWAAIRSAYFVVAMKPLFEGASAWQEGNTDHFRLGLAAGSMALQPGTGETRSFKLYMGPRMEALMEPAWPGLGSLVAIFTVWGWDTMAGFMNWFAGLMLHIMNWFYSVIPNYGLAIIFVTLIVRMVLFPLTYKSMKSMKKMQLLAPEMEKIKAEVGEDQQEMQKRMMELYRERGVNPLGGCFPLLLQMPVFIAFYRMLSNAFELRREPFMLWITDLSEPDTFLQLPFSLPFGIDGLHLLPILMAGAMVLSQKLTPSSGPVQNQQQKMMMTFMPIFFAVICYKMPASLNLYILTSTLLGIGQNYLIHTSAADIEPKKQVKRKTAAKPKHFYNAAQARKKQIAKEARRQKKKQDR